MLGKNSIPFVLRLLFLRLCYLLCIGGGVRIIQAFSFLCTFVPGSQKSTERTFAPMELSFCGTSAPWNFRSLGANIPRTFIPWNIRSCGTFVARERTFQELSFLWNCCSMRTNIPRTFAPNVLKHDLKLAINLTVAYAH